MPNPLCHFEFMTGDLAKCQAFYGKVFDWQFDDKSIPGYSLINAGSEPSGGGVSVGLSVGSESLLQEKVRAATTMTMMLRSLKCAGAAP